MSHNPGPYTPPNIDEPIHEREAFFAKYKLPQRLVVCFETLKAEVAIRPEVGPTVFDLFYDFRVKDEFPRYEGRYAKSRPLSDERGAIGIYDMSEALHARLGEVQTRIHDLGVDFVTYTPKSGYGWLQRIEGVAPVSGWMEKAEEIISEIENVYWAEKDAIDRAAVKEA